MQTEKIPLSEKFSMPQKSTISKVIKIPCINGLGKTEGCQRAGNKIIEALYDIHTNEAGKKIDVQALNLEEIHIDNSNIEEANNLIYKNSFEGFEENDKVVFLGGDHSISFSTCKAFLDYCSQNNKQPFLVVFDAHLDLMQAMKEPTHEEWLRALIEKKFPIENIIVIGARNPYIAEKEFAVAKNLRVFYMANIWNIEELSDVVMEQIANKELYISVDIDAVDPGFAPATGYQEPGGMSSRQLIHFIKKLVKFKNLKALDIVEINPEKSGANRTIKLGAKILSEVI